MSDEESVADNRTRDDADRLATPAAINETGVVPVLRARSAQRFPAVTETLLEVGVRVIEVTMTSAGALDTISNLAQRMPQGTLMGAGTVLDVLTADAVIDAGAQFLVTPSLVPQVIHAGLARGVPTYAGALTPTEALSAWTFGAKAVKVFPASLGGPDYLRALAGPFPQIPFMPTGGISIDDAPQYIAAGALAVGMGGPLLQDATEPDGDLSALGLRASRLLDLVAQARSLRGDQ